MKKAEQLIPEIVSTNGRSVKFELNRMNAPEYYEYVPANLANIYVKKLRLAVNTLLDSFESHYECEDSWYSCPLSESGCANDCVGEECNCGAERHNKKIISAIEEITEMNWEDILEEKQ